MIEKIECECECCGNPFDAHEYDVSRGYARFCSNRCKYRARKFIPTSSKPLYRKLRANGIFPVEALKICRRS